MEELTVEELIKYAVRVQQDSFIFYRKAGRKLEGNQLKRFTDLLADNTAERLAALKNLLSECFLEGEDLSDMQAVVDTSPFDDLLENGAIPFYATPVDLLRISYNREQSVKRTYDMILRLPLPSKRVSRVFNTLRSKAEHNLKDIQDQLRGRST
jgi:rubrerythrin